MRKAPFNARAIENRALEDGIEWIIARELEPVQQELARLRASVEEPRETVQPW